MLSAGFGSSCHSLNTCLAPPDPPPPAPTSHLIRWYCSLHVGQASGPTSASKLPLVLAASLGPRGDSSACSDAASPGNSGSAFISPAFSPATSPPAVDTPDRCSPHRGQDSSGPAAARTPFDSPALFYEASHLTASLFSERRDGDEVANVAALKAASVPLASRPSGASRGKPR